MAKWYITTPIYYVNAPPHIGHAYTTFAADVLAVWHRMRGDEVFFLAGTDENAQKNSEAAARGLGKHHDVVTRDEVQSYVDRMSATWQRTWDTLGVRYDRFIRTTDPQHVAGVHTFINAVRDAGDIYPGTYTGWYCVDCEAFLPEKELRDGMCPMHARAVSRIEEQNLFFRLSKYRDALLKHFTTHPHFVQPESRRNEILAYIRDHLEDISISRPMRRWGIPFPGDPSQAVYVWFDALVNYLTGVGYGTEDQSERLASSVQHPASSQWWPANVHLVGKDIIKFHCALWPAMLMSAGLPLPERVFAHGFFTINGEKMSKSRGNVVDPLTIAERYGTDVLRFFLFREISFGSDGDFSEERLRERYTADLQHGIGNLAARLITMVKKYADGIIPAAGATPCAGDEWRRYENAMDALLLHDAVQAAMDLARQADRAIDEAKPWVLAKDATQQGRLLTVLGNCCEMLRHSALMLAPFTPDTAEKLLTALGHADWHTRSLAELQRWGTGAAGTPIGDLPHLFPALS